jgi:hypothetical protein
MSKQHVSGGDGFDPRPTAGYVVRFIVWAFVLAGIIMCIATELGGG